MSNVAAAPPPLPPVPVAAMQSMAVDDADADDTAHRALVEALLGRQSRAPAPRFAGVDEQLHAQVDSLLDAALAREGVLPTATTTTTAAQLPASHSAPTVSSATVAVVAAADDALVQSEQREWMQRTLADLRKERQTLADDDWMYTSG
jgi:hypothetical protein